MSADNWAQCPRCADNREAKIQAAQAALDDAYGKIPLEQFDAQRARLDAMKADRPEPTFREDYEFAGAASGTLEVRYKGHCTRCGLTHELEQTHDFYPEPKAAR